MPRKRRRCPGGLAYHVMNRATAWEAIFHAPGDYAAFERVLAEARRRELEGPGAEGGRVRLCSYVLMPNHWHLVLWPEVGADGAVTRFMKWLTLTHAQRWHAHSSASSPQAATPPAPARCTGRGSAPSPSSRTGTSSRSAATWSATR